MNRHQRRAAKAQGKPRDCVTHADCGVRTVRPLTADSVAKLKAVAGPAGLAGVADLDEMADRAGLTDIAETLREFSHATGLMCEITDRQQLIALADLDQGVSLGQGVPTTMVVQDRHPSSGPATWRGAAALAKWAKFAVVQSSPEFFDAAAEAAELWERVVLVTTSTNFMQEWAETFRGMPVLRVLANRSTEWTPQGAHLSLPMWETLN